MSPPGPAPSALQRRLPNALSVGRLFLTLLLILLLSAYHFPDRAAWALPTALALFVIAAATDALDGYLARKWNVVSLFGRIVDPAADKFLVLGTLVFLASPIFVPQDGAPLARVVTGVQPWMVAIILGRELMVSSVRAVLESEGVDASANLAGKIKMIVQSLAIPVTMLAVWLGDPAALTEGAWLRLALDALWWVVTLLTAASSLPYGVHMLTHMGARRASEFKP